MVSRKSPTSPWAASWRRSRSRRPTTRAAASSRSGNVSYGPGLSLPGSDLPGQAARQYLGERKDETDPRLMVVGNCAGNVSRASGVRRPHRRIALVRRSIDLIPELEGWLKDGETLEYRIRDDLEQTYEKYIGEIDIWRNQVVRFLDRLMPQSGASIRFSVADGDYGVGPLLWEMTRLRRQRANLAALLDQLEVYLRRSYLQK